MNTGGQLILGGGLSNGTGQPLISSVRKALGAFDRLSVILQGAFARFNGIVLQWIPATEACHAVAALDARGAEIIPDDPNLLQVWTESLPTRVPADVIRLLAPSADLTTPVDVRILRDRPVWRQVLHGTVELANTTTASTGAGQLLIDGLWLVLTAIGLPSGGILVDNDGHATGVCDDPASSEGRRVSWDAVAAQLGKPVSARLRLVSETITHLPGHTPTSAPGMLLAPPTTS